ncbi:MAG: cytochrome C, partial [Sideroxyarcus sp.]|nr:cytochrome C [Sideroxyarcus sp.]
MRNQFNLPALLRVLVYACALPVCALQVRADPVDELLMPGAVIAGHAKYEGECSSCHKQFDKPAQIGLCRDCHKEIAKDIDEKRGYHGLMREEKACKECHTDHKGRDARVAELETDGFDHETTGYTLKGAHLNSKVLCKDCHPPQKKYRDAPVKCNSCHEKADKHKGRLGPECQNCHEEKDWKTTHYDHSKTKFELLGKHKEVKCIACHLKHKYKNTPTLCNDCHRKNDKHKGKFGPKCETCHTERNWKEIPFDHDKKTKYPLLGKHRDIKCVDCHKGDIYKDKLKQDCYSCHKKDDKHEGQEGKKCEACHREQSWKKSDFNHLVSRFPLTGKHLLVECKKCHLTPKFKDAKSDCWSCHEKQDKEVHKRTLGTDCQTCHNTRNWQSWDFNHDKTRFKL